MAAEQENECNGKGSVENEACQEFWLNRSSPSLWFLAALIICRTIPVRIMNIPNATAATNTVFIEPMNGSVVIASLRMQPEGRYDILKSEEAAEQESEDHREYRAGTHDRCQIHLLVVVQQCAANQQTQSLPYIGKHDSENKCIGKSYDNRRVNFIVIWQSVHLHVHLKRTEDFRIFSFVGG